jgi:hypothetical protein
MNGNFVNRDAMQEMQQLVRKFENSGLAAIAATMREAVAQLAPLCEEEKSKDKPTRLAKLYRFDKWNFPYINPSRQAEVERFVAAFNEMYGEDALEGVLRPETGGALYDDDKTTDDKRVVELIEVFWSDDKEFLNETLIEVPAGYKWEIVQDACENYGVRVFNPYP